MKQLCPRPCGGLATAAIFIAAGVVQLISGLILIRSKYVYLLSGPDFWTASANISVGCLLGVAASIWKHPRKRRTLTAIARYNLLAALLVSSIMVNATTCTILILSEGSTLLSIQLERSGKRNVTTLNSEMLGYAYAASVISPALCIAVAVFSLSIRCCPAKSVATKKTKRSRKIRRKVLQKEDSNIHQWVFTDRETSESRTPALATTSTSSSASEFDSNIVPSSLAFSSPASVKHWRFAGLKKSPSNYSGTDFDKSLRTLDDSDPYGQSFDMSMSGDTAMAGEVVPVRVNRLSSKSPSRIGIPFSCPMAPTHLGSQTLVKAPTCSTVSAPYPLPHTKSPAANNYNFGKTRSSFVSFHDERLKAEFERQCPQLESIAKYHFQRDRSKVAPMASIMEATSDGSVSSKHNRNSQVTLSPAQTSGYCSSPENTVGASSRPETPAVDYPKDAPKFKVVPHTAVLSKIRLFQKDSEKADEDEELQEMRL